MIKNILYLIFIMPVLSYTSEKPRVWERIPRYVVSNYVNSFLNENRITNCYNYIEDRNNLLLKCWRDERLTDVSIKIYPNKKKKTIYYQTLSVTV